MTYYRAAMGQDGHITVPAEVCELLGLAPDDDLEFNVDADNRVILTRAKYTLKTVFGSVKPLIPMTGMDIQEVIRLAKDDYYMEKYGPKDE